MGHLLAPVPSSPAAPTATPSASTAAAAVADTQGAPANSAPANGASMNGGGHGSSSSSSGGGDEDASRAALEVRWRLALEGGSRQPQQTLQIAHKPPRTHKGSTRADDHAHLQIP